MMRVLIKFFSQLFANVAPKTAENFRLLCTGNSDSLIHAICDKFTISSSFSYKLYDM